MSPGVGEGNSGRVLIKLLRLPYGHLLATKVDLSVYELWGPHGYKVWVSAGSRTQWKWAIFVGDKINTKEKPCDDTQSYDFNTSTL